MGKVKNNNIGFMNKLVNAISNPAIIAVLKLAIVIPGISHPTNKIHNDNSIIFNISLNILNAPV